MQRVPATVEEQLILKAINEECPWESLPKRLQATLSSKEEWHRRIVEHCIKKRLQWNACFARKICKESEYYEDMMRYLRKNLALFPYHLAEYVCRVMRISPFRYYCDMIFEVMKNESEYYEDMMRYLRKNLALFPYHLAEYVCRVMRISPFRYYCDMIFEVMKNEQPYDSIPNFSAADALRLTGIGRNEFIDIMNKCRSKKIMWKLNKSIAKELLPTQPVDFAIEPWWGVSLVNFTLEEFKRLSEEEMATIDKVCKEEANSYILFDPDIIKGLYRWGLIYFDVPVYPDDRFKVSRLEGFVSNREQSYEDPIEELLYAVFVVSSENSTVAELAATLQADLSQLQAAASFACRLGWAVKVIDPASILQDTSVGSPRAILSDEEASHASIGSENIFVDGDAALQGDASGAENYGPGSMYARVAFVVDANITSYLMMGSVSPGLKSHAVTLYEAGKLGHASIADLCKDLSTLEGAKFEGELQEFANHASSLRCVLECLQSGGVATDVKAGKVYSNVDKIASSNDEATSLEAEITVNEDVESSGIDEDGVNGDDNCLSGDFKNINILDDEKVNPVEGTPWMKLVLYTTVACGPLSVVLMKGQCLRLLPAPLAGCEKALLWSWDGSTVGGLGGKFKGNLVKGNILLHCLNSLLKHSAVLVQPLSKYDLDESGRVVTLDIPLPLKNCDGSTGNIEKEMELSEEESKKLNSLLAVLANKMELWTVGYIRLLKLFKERESDKFSPDDEKHEWVPLSVEFGVPLFSPKLCNNICKRVVSSQLLQTDSLHDHHEAMQGLRKRLRDVCAEYQATGPAAKLLYQKEKSKESSRHLMNYASGRWNPLVDPSSPISGALSEHQRLKLANRHRCRTEVLSFDGSILRSYALTPVYEAATRPIEEAPSLSTAKAEQEEAESREVVLPGVNLLFDGSELHPFDIGACLQARQPVSLIAEAAASSAAAAAAIK
ncbi:hypothetical protein L484_013190 [Morus notabilis]|uniref:Protein FAM91A1 n=1 Tax=Morus notabilis TaxID=981085 RepID=W9REJ9_9ROSA|nr:hypothetical protein L484_013190 [Morus notabilis]